MIKYNTRKTTFIVYYWLVGFYTGRYDGEAQSVWTKYWEANFSSSLHKIRDRNQSKSAKLNKDII